jgi:hypothetical protein
VGIIDSIHWPTFAGAVAVAFLLFIVAMFVARSNTNGYS